MNTMYEWDIETSDEVEILEHRHADRLSEYDEEHFQAEPGEFKTLVLVRDCGLGERLWAYVKEGALPEFFSDAYGRERTDRRVPKRFGLELKGHLVRAEYWS